MNTFEKDVKCIKDALEFYIITEEDRLIDANAGDSEWGELQPYQDALRNINFLDSIYG